MSKLKNPILLESVITISSFLLSPFTGCQVYKLMPEIAVKQKLYQPFILCTSPHSCGKKSQESQKQLHQPHCILSSLYLYTIMSTFSHLFRDPQFWPKYYFVNVTGTFKLHVLTFRKRCIILIKLFGQQRSLKWAIRYFQQGKGTCIGIL